MSTSKPINRLYRHPFALIVPCSLLFFLVDSPGLSIVLKLILAAVSVGLFFLMRRTQVASFMRNSSRGIKVLFAAVIVYAAFAFMGHDLFLAAYPVQRAAIKIIFFILFCGWIAFPAITLLYLTDICKQRLAARYNQPATTPAYSTARLYTIWGGILFIGWILYFFGFYPGNMSVDSLVQYQQALHITPLTDLHPVFHTVIIRVLLNIWQSPAIVTLFQIVYMAAIASSFLVFLYKAGLPYKWVLIFTVITALLPPNGIMVVVLWKDIPYCTSLIWLTLVLAELVTGKYIFNYKTTLVCLVCSLTGVALFRHNGNLAALIVAILLIGWALKSRRTGIALSSVVFLLVFVAYKKIFVPNIMQVQPVPAAFTTIPLVHAMGSVIFYNGTLSPETKQQMNTLLPNSVWKSNYTPHSADEYLYQTGPDFIPNLSKVPTSTILGLYGSTFTRNPFLIVKDRLCGSEMMWNIFQGEGSSNYSFHTEITENDLNLQQHDTVLKSVLLGLVKFSGRALDPLSRRAGVYNVLLLLLFVYVVRQRKDYGFIFLPLFAGNFSLLLSMTFQSYRYVYYAPLLFGFLFLLAVSPMIHRKKALF